MYRPQRLSYPHLCGFFCFYQEGPPSFSLAFFGEFLSLYHYAWQTAFKNIDYVEKDGWKPILTCMPGVGITWQWDSCFLTLLQIIPMIRSLLLTTLITFTDFDDKVTGT